MRKFADSVMTILVAKKGAKQSEILKELEKLPGAAQRTTKVV